jgi:hypothetical protein
MACCSYEHNLTNMVISCTYCTTFRCDVQSLSLAKIFTHPRGKQFTHPGVRVELILL